MTRESWPGQLHLLQVWLRHVIGTLYLRDAKSRKDLEAKMSEFLGTEDTILYSSAFDANGGVFEPLLGEQMRSFPTS